MKPTNLTLLLVLTGIAVFSRCAYGKSPPQDSAATIVQPSENAALTGYVSNGDMRYPNDMDRVRYLYLHLSKPIDIFIGAAGPHSYYAFHVYDVQLEADPIPRSKLESEIGKRVTVVGRLPAPPGANNLAPFALTMFVQAVKVAN